VTPGDHDLSVQIKDWGSAEGLSRTRHITVQQDSLPRIIRIESLYGAQAYYSDGSIFYTPNITTSFTIVGSAESYYGQIHSYRYRFRSRAIPNGDGSAIWSDWAEWSQWGQASFQMPDLDVGEYMFETVCRDWAGAESMVQADSIFVVEPDFSRRTILIVDETKDGNGRAGSPNDLQCDNFYRDILSIDTLTMTTTSGWGVSEIDYSQHQKNGVSYISALDVFDKRLIIWHGDDKSQTKLGENTRILSDYLDKGGKLILSGHNVLAPFTEENVPVFTSGFVFKYLRLSGASKTTEANTTGGLIGMEGLAEKGYPVTISLDMDKISSRWKGLDNCWTFTPRHRTESIGTWMGFNELSEWQGLSCCVRNFNPVNPWRTIVTGFPLYFMVNEEAKEFIERAIEDINN